MAVTTIRIHGETKGHLDRFREYKSESYDEVISKLIFIAEKARDRPQLSQEAVVAIEKARERMRRGDYVSHDELKRRLGL